MKQPLEIRFIGMESSDAVESAAREKAGKLDRFRPDIMACRVTIELAEKHRHQGRPFAVRVDVTVPDHELRVDRVHDEDVYVALREAFDDMTRQLQDSVRRVRGEEKLHASTLHGEVVRFADDGHCGFIRTAEGDEYWFGPENMAGAPFEHLAPGDHVQFVPEVAAEGRQAKRVSVGKRHAA
ncbi:sigma-54 modulation/S30EA ribosomal family protein [Variovorax paradoxus B4]|uniref:Sigma-54 modulation/S30EA ribosomal family protein n=1 Tax=Variovorax paradoxus B4 TaxID=1246301 RepID=T1XKA3_VARPD|nr:HPF/RaiA family ribosome-associated protein [Variovorax paradoxus]AGU52986.1 sigma-54 modulation/S30EA ribosomal family protein [Variovorax paradoxus B4]